MKFYIRVKIKKRLITFLFILMITGCSIKHPVAIDYDKHLLKYGVETTLPITKIKAKYFINEKTKKHNYQFRAGTVGVGHLWIVEYGKILDKTLNSRYVQSAFGKLDKSESGNETNENLIKFKLEGYRFEDHRAYTELNIKVLENGSEVFNKTYSSEGRSQGGQMRWAKSYGMKNAILKSTKQSTDKIFKEFIDDINNKSW